MPLGDMPPAPQAVDADMTGAWAEISQAAEDDVGHSEPRKVGYLQRKARECVVGDVDAGFLSREGG